MITYSLWISIVDEFTMYTSAFEKMAWYGFASFMSVFTIILDIVTVPFQLIGILIYLITQRRNK